MISYKEIDKIIGFNLKQYRIRKNYSLNDIGKQLNVSKSTVYFWEVGRNAISVSVLKKYCDVLNISLEDFVKSAFAE